MSKRKYSPEMQKKLEEYNKKDEETPVMENKPSSFPHVALGMYAIQEGPATRYVVVEIPYDPVSGDVGFIKQIVKDNNVDATVRFKIEVDNNGFFTGVKKRNE